MLNILMHMVASIILAFVIHILLHELGHMIGGLLTGWRLIYLQIFNVALVKNNRFYKFKKIDTYGYQCIMYPTILRCHNLLYTTGGCIMNLIGALIGILNMIYYHSNVILWLYSWSFFATGLIYFIFNAVPNTKRKCNDGACFKLLISDARTRLCHNYQLLAARQLHEGYTYKEIGRNIICTLQGSADNDILAYQAVLECYYWMELQQFNLMQEALDKIVRSSYISRNIQDIIDMECLYAELLQHLRDMDIDSIDKNKYEGDILKYIKLHGSSGDVHSERVKAAYEVYEQLTVGKGKEALESINKAIQYIQDMKCLYSGEALFCINQLERLRELCNSMYFIKLR